MPICIECRHPVKTLWREGAGDKSGGHNIRLTVCRNCGRFCDKYVEHDFVVLFIDLVLIKPQVYRHLLHNTLMRSAAAGGSGGNAADSDDEFAPSIVRLGVLLLLFDVYLTWARIEKQAVPTEAAGGDGGFGRLTAMGIGWQYLFFREFFGLTFPSYLATFKLTKLRSIVMRHDNSHLPPLDPLPQLQPLLPPRHAGPAAALLASQLGQHRAAGLELDQALPHTDGHLGVRRARRGAVARLGRGGEQR
jgi:hypothetical protein